MSDFDCTYRSGITPPKPPRLPWSPYQAPPSRKRIETLDCWIVVFIDETCAEVDIRKNLFDVYFAVNTGTRVITAAFQHRYSGNRHRERSRTGSEGTRGGF